MAAIHTRFIQRTFLNSSFSTIRCFSSKNKYFKKYKHRRNPKLNDFDVNEILYTKTGHIDQGAVVMSGDVAKTAQETSSNSWFHSKERLKSLKTTEKAIAVVAVVAMLLGYFGIKWMVSMPPSKQTEIQTEESTNEPATVQTAS